LRLAGAVRPEEKFPVNDRGAPYVTPVHATRLYDDPLVIYCKRWSLFAPNQGPAVDTLHPIVGVLADRPVAWLIPCPWLAEDAWAADGYRQVVAALTTVAPRHRIIVVANTWGEHRHFESLGLESFVANQNQFVDRAIFKPTAAAGGRPFDAVYNARFRRFKRHELAAEIPRLTLVGYEFDAPEFASIRALLPAAHLANELARSTRRLGSAEVNTALNSAACGLCLSAEEGAMTAAGEYLLAGLPVVTTASRGGRDYFLDGRFTRWVEPLASHVAREVAYLVAEQIPPAFIREETLRKFDAANEAFLDAVASRLSLDRALLAARFRARFNHRLALAKPAETLLPERDSCA
jgi:glycosyltransferase involved in cell wall biosynthesis